MERRLAFGLVLTAIILAAACGTETASTPKAVPLPEATPAATVPVPPTSTPAVTATPLPTQISAPGPTPALVAAQVTTTRLPDLGTVLADAGGRTLYLLNLDERNVSTCASGCALTWPPLLAVGDTFAGEGVAADRLRTITRDDGLSQVTFNGRPLYRYSQDEKPGDAKGQTQGGVWFVVSTYGGPVQSNAAVSSASIPVLGAMLVDASGRTLYGFANDGENASRCTGGCALTSPPLLTLGDPSGGASIAPGQLGTVSREDGSTQVAYNGRPLYYYSQDDKPGDAKGHNRDGVWSVVSSEAPLAVSLTLAPSKDATLYEDPVGAFANGAGEYLFTGKINRGSSRRALIAFNLAGSIPPGATIKSVSLTLNMSRTVAGAGLVELRRVLADWGEGASDASANEGGGTFAESGDATWIHRNSDTARWQSPGGDFSPEASASATVAGVGTYTWGPTPQLVADVQAWLDDPSANFGWLLLGTESGKQTTKRFDSRENLGDQNRPKLTIEFTSGTGEGPEPGIPSPAEEKGAY